MVAAEQSGLPRLQSNPSSSWRLRTASRAQLQGFDFTQGSLSAFLPPLSSGEPLGFFFFFLVFFLFFSFF